MLKARWRGLNTAETKKGALYTVTSVNKIVKTEDFGARDPGVYFTFINEFGDIDYATSANFTIPRQMQHWFHAKVEEAYENT